MTSSQCQISPRFNLSALSPVRTAVPCQAPAALTLPHPSDSTPNSLRPKFADYFAPTAHTQTMSVQSGHLRARSSLLETILAEPLPSQSPFAIYSLLRHHFPLKMKKSALRLVQNALNFFIINRILEKSRRKNVRKRAKFDLFGPFSSLFQGFSATSSIRRIFASYRQPISCPLPATRSTGYWLMPTGYSRYE